MNCQITVLPAGQKLMASAGENLQVFAEKRIYYGCSLPQYKAIIDL